MTISYPGGLLHRSCAACGALLWLIAAAAYLLLEYKAAAEFRVDYSYARHYISDLGVTTPGVFDGRLLDSPRAGLMNSAFILQGILLLSGALLIVHALVLPEARGFLTMITVETLGIIIVGIFHSGAADLANRTIIFHLIGASAAVACGLVAVLTGSRLLTRHCHTPRWYRSVSIGLVILSASSFVLLGISRVIPAMHALPDGALERVGVYALFTWPVITGAWLFGHCWRLHQTKADVGMPIPIGSSPGV